MRLDPLSREQRSALMARVRCVDTAPELTVRRIVSNLGYRYRLHVAGLPGKPDLVFRRLHKVIFVHGCFWHQHTCPNGQRCPKSRVRFWRRKLDGNVERDRRQRRALRKAGWRVLVVWECQTRSAGLQSLVRKLSEFLRSNGGIRHR